MNKLMPIEELPLSSRTISELKREQIRTVQDLILCDEEKLMNFRKLYYRRIYEIKNAVHELGFIFANEDISVLKTPDNYLMQSIAILDIPLNPLKALKSEKIYTMGELLSYKSHELKQIPFIDNFSIRLIKASLHAKGIIFQDEDNSILDERNHNIDSYLSEKNLQQPKEKIEILNLPNYLYCILKRNKINTVEELLSYDIMSLSKIKHLGITNIKKIIDILSIHGYHFEDENSIVFLKTKVKKITKI